MTTSLSEDDEDRLVRSVLRPHDDCVHNVAPLFEEVERIKVDAVDAALAAVETLIVEWDSMDAYLGNAGHGRSICQDDLRTRIARVRAGGEVA